MPPRKFHLVEVLFHEISQTESSLTTRARKRLSYAPIPAHARSISVSIHSCSGAHNTACVAGKGDAAVVSTPCLPEPTLPTSRALTPYDV